MTVAELIEVLNQRPQTDRVFLITEDGARQAASEVVSDIQGFVGIRAAEYKHRGKIEQAWKIYG